jgi:RHS repeat-associated protein
MRRLASTVCIAVAATLLVAAAGLVAAPGARAEALSAAELEKFPVIMQWVYRNSPVKDPLACGEGCSSLWTAEQAVGYSPTDKEMWNQIGTFETSNGLWPPLSQLRSDMRFGIEFSTSAFQIGWEMLGSSPKWLELGQVGAGGPAKPIYCYSEGPYVETLLEPGESYGQPPGAGLGPQPMATTWMYLAYQRYCALSGLVGYYQSTPTAKCGLSTEVPPPWPYWENLVQRYAYCDPESETATADAALRTDKFEFARPEDVTGQVATHVLEDNEPKTVPIPETIEVAFKKALEEDATLNRWLKYMTTGEGSNPTLPRQPSEELGGSNPGEPSQGHPCEGDPVDCASGNDTDSQTDVHVGGRGVPLALTRTYNSQAAVAATSPGLFGYGWTSTFSDHLTINTTTGTVVVNQANGSTVSFTGNLSAPGELTRPLWVQAKLVLNSDGTYLYTLPDEETFHFSSSGRLLSEADRDGNTTTLSYSEAGRLETITDAAGRKLTLAYNSEGRVESVKDPMGHTAKYTYEGNNLASVTEPGEASPRWQFKYDGSHQLTEEVDGRGGKTANEYNASHQVVSQTDPLGRILSFEYHTEAEGHSTNITNHSTGAVTKEIFDAVNELTATTHGYGTASATTEAFTYDGLGDMLSRINGDGYTTSYTYDASGNRTSEQDADGDEARWTYDGTHDVLTSTTPDGETTTIKREAHGNPEVVERPAPGAKTQVTKYAYDSHGDLESVEDPLKRVTRYEYDGYGDRTAETDPEGDKRTWGYDEDSQRTSMVSPRGNVEGVEASKYTTKLELDAQGRLLKLTDPLGHTTKYVYDGDGNVESMTDANGHTTKYTYDADDELTITEEPKANTTETGYDGDGQVTSQTDGDKHVTKYVRNVLAQVTEVVDAKERKTTKEYDPAGNLKAVTDAAKRTTSYAYDAANRLKEVTYSDGKTAAVKYEYNGDGERTKMTDGTGESAYTYDELDRLTETKNGHGEKAGYEYDLANELTKLTYPNGKAVTREYDKAGRLAKVTDWLGNATRFSYDPDSDQTATTFPSATGDEDKYGYDEADRISEVRMSKGAEALASLAYTRDNDGAVKGVTSKGLPGEEKPAYEYDTDNRLTKGGATSYLYGGGNNPIKIGTGSYSYDKADEIETGPSLKYTYNEVGQRTKTTPTGGSATTYGYDQAGNLISVERPKEGEKAAINDTYAYDGNGLRTSQTGSGVTTYLAWDTNEALSLLLAGGLNSFIYGPNGLPIEQINTTGGTVFYLHHDQQGSTRLVTGTTGKTETTITYDAYGNQTGHTGSVTAPLGYDAQYTSQDTGLIYLRARVYDPATGQFLSRDPAVALTREPYDYAGDNPLTYKDRSGLGIEEVLEGGGSGIPCPWCGATQGISEALEGAYHEVQHGLEWINSHVGAEELNEPAKQGEAAAQAGCELLEKDGTGKVHGAIPSYPNPDWTEEDLDQVAQDLRDSIDARQEELRELGEESAHRARIGSEEKLLRQIDKQLGEY